MSISIVNCQLTRCDHRTRYSLFRCNVLLCFHLIILTDNIHTLCWSICFREASYDCPGLHVSWTTLYYVFVIPRHQVSYCHIDYFDTNRDPLYPHIFNLRLFTWPYWQNHIISFSNAFVPNRHRKSMLYTKIFPWCLSVYPNHVRYKWANNAWPLRLD